MNISKISQHNYNCINNKAKSNNIAFCAKADSKIFKPVKKVVENVAVPYNRGVDCLAKGVSRFLQNESVFKTIEWSKKNKLLMNHLMTFGSTILSGFYVIRTLGNKNLDEKKKKTLAINQSLVFGLSTLTCYTVESKIFSKVNTFANHFEAVNHKYMQDAAAELVKLKKGIKPASKIVVFDIIFRFMAPVFLTPVANHFGNKLNEKHDAELALKQKINETR